MYQLVRLMRSGSVLIYFYSFYSFDPSIDAWGIDLHHPVEKERSSPWSDPDLYLFCLGFFFYILGGLSTFAMGLFFSSFFLFWWWPLVIRLIHVVTACRPWTRVVLLVRFIWIHLAAFSRRARVCVCLTIVFLSPCFSPSASLLVAVLYGCTPSTSHFVWNVFGLVRWSLVLFFYSVVLFFFYRRRLHLSTDFFFFYSSFDSLSLQYFFLFYSLISIDTHTNTCRRKETEKQREIERHRERESDEKEWIRPFTVPHP